MGAYVSRTASALAALSASEKATVLDEVLAVRPDLRELAETHATRLMSTEDRCAVANDVAATLRGFGHRGTQRPRRIPARSRLRP